MKKIPAILYLKSARNAEHYNLQEALLKAVPADFATQYKLAGLRGNYQSLFEKEDSIYLQNQGFAGTKELSDKDAVRDRLFRLVRLTAQSKELSLVPEEAAAGRQLAFAMKPYGNAASKPDAENTAMVSDLLKKLQSEEYSPYVQTLGLAGAVAALKTANDEFAELYSRRADEKRERTVAEKLLQVRPLVDEAARKLFEAINAVYMVSEVVEEDAAKMAAVGAVVDAVNAEIVQFSETLSRRGIGSKTKVGPDDKPLIPPEGGGGGEEDRPVIE